MLVIYISIILTIFWALIRIPRIFCIDFQREDANKPWERFQNIWKKWINYRKPSGNCISFHHKAYWPHQKFKSAQSLNKINILLIFTFYQNIHNIWYYYYRPVWFYYNYLLNSRKVSNLFIILSWKSTTFSTYLKMKQKKNKNKMKPVQSKTLRGFHTHKHTHSRGCWLHFKNSLPSTA